MNRELSPVSVPRWARTAIFCSMLAMDFTGFACYSVMGPFFPTEAQRKGVTQTVTGLIFSSYAFTVLLSSSIWGHFISRSSPRSFVIWGGVVCGLANIAFGFLSLIEDGTTFTIACFAVRITEGLAFAAINTGIFATMGRLFPDSLGSAMASVEMAIGVGMGVGPAVGSALYTVGGYPAPFMTLGVAVLVCTTMVYLLITCIPCVETEIFATVQSETKLTLGKLLKIPAAFVTLLTVFGCACAFTVLMPIFALHLLEIGIDENTSGYVFSIELGVYAVAAVIVGKLSDRYPKRRFRMIICGLWIQGVALAVLGPSQIFEWLDLPIENTLLSNAIGLVLVGAGGALVLIPSYGVLIDATRDAGFLEGTATHGIVGGAWNSFYTTGDMAGPAAGAALTEQISYRAATSIFALAEFAFALLATIFVTCLASRRRSMKDSNGPNITCYNALDTSSGPHMDKERSPLLHGLSASRVF